jgi:polysaccharide biosynthesis/export protein
MCKHIRFRRLPFFLLLFSLSVACIAQENAEVKAKAEAELQKMTPEQIDAKIKEAGMTRAEAEAKAKEYGIDLEQYLSSKRGLQQKQQGPPPLQPGKLQPSQSQQFQPQLRAGQILPPGQQPLAPIGQPLSQITSVPESLKVEPIPGFAGRSNAEGLGLFGYNIFNFPESTFEPVVNVPTPQNYTLGPGDEIILTIWGETQLDNQLVVNREGEIVIPNVGPVVAQGLTITKLKERLLSRLSTVYSGLRGGAAGANTWMDLSVGKLRSIQIFVLGEVRKPGSYVVSSMATGLLGLYVSGGPTVNGSLRDVQIKRDNKIISSIDFYEFAIRGDKSKDVRIQDGDVIFVRPAGKRVALAGSVLRPAIYELKEGDRLSTLIALAGGVSFNTYTDRIHIERIIPFAERKKYKKNILDIDLKLTSLEDLQKSGFALEDGDIVSFLKVNEYYQNRVSITGNVKKPGTFELTKGMRVRDLVKQADGYLSDTFEERANILRILPNMRKEIVPFDLGKAVEGDSVNNIELESEDEVTIYNKGYFFPEHPVSISGSIRNPGTSIRTDNMMLSDLLVLAGGLTEDALSDEVTVTRIDTTSETVYSQTYTIATSRDYWRTDRTSDFLLKDNDYVFVPSNPNYHKMKLVNVSGEVKYPGNYALLYDGERIASIIKRAGGLKKIAYIEGAHLTRRAGGAGMVPVNFITALEDPTSRENIQVVEGDSIEISKNPGVIYVRGEVGVPSAVMYAEGADLNYYIEQAGGYKDGADESRTVVMQPNGRKWKSSWFFFPDGQILAGATITVPTRVERENNTLPVLRDWATIFASLATMMIAIVQITK